MGFCCQTAKEDNTDKLKSPLPPSPIKLMKAID